MEMMATGDDRAANHNRLDGHPWPPGSARPSHCVTVGQCSPFLRVFPLRSFSVR